MLKILEICINFFLIVIIFLRIPQESVGLASVANKTNLFGSPRSAQRFLNILTFVAILIYFNIAYQVNLLNNQI